MGLLVVDPTFWADIGMTIAGVVISFRPNYTPVEISKQIDGTYKISGRYHIWGYQDAYNNGSNPIIKQKEYMIVVTEEDLNENIFSKLYDSLKVIYPSALDC